MRCHILHTANAGIFLRIGGTNCFIDAFPYHAVNGFDALTDQQVETLFRSIAPISPDFLLVTHDHPDHHSLSLTHRAVTHFPEMRVILPWEETFSNTSSGENWFVNWFSIPHAHATSATQVTNYGALIQCGKYRFFTPGDADPRFPGIYDLVNGLQPDVAFLNFPWITLPSASRNLSALQARHIIISHLPVATSDPFHFREAAQAALQMHPNAQILDQFMQEIVLTL